MSAEQQRPELARIVAQSARSIPNLIALGTWLATGLLVGHLWLVIAGSCLYVLLVARKSMSRRFWRKILEADAELSRQLPRETSLTDPALQMIVRSIHKGYDEIARVLRETPDPVKAHLGLAVSSLDNLRLQAAQLIRDADELGRYLLVASREGTQSEIRRLNEAITGASDPGVKLEYEGALSVRQDQLAAIARVALERERIVAALQFIVCTIEAFPAWIYRMRVLEFRAKDDRVSESHEELTRMKMELAASQHLLEGLARSPGRFIGDDDEPRAEPNWSSESGGETPFKSARLPMPTHIHVWPDDQ
jgi:hypothetical protein